MLRSRSKDCQYETGVFPIWRAWASRCGSVVKYQQVIWYIMMDIIRQEYDVIYCMERSYQELTG